jgi:hypothetical protein
MPVKPDCDTIIPHTWEAPMTNRRLMPALTVPVILAATLSLAADFDSSFDDATLRVDFYQVGAAESEEVVLDRLLRQGPWAGPTQGLAEPDPVGRTVARLVDPETGAILVETAFDSLFGEYRATTPAAAGVVRAFHESVLLPFPVRDVRLSLSSRDETGGEELLLETDIDPGAVEIAAEAPAADALVIEELISGPVQTSLDIAFVGEGYTADQLDLFRSDLSRFAALLLEQQPYASARDLINVRGVVVPSPDPGCDEPTRGRWRRTAVGASFNALGSPRYLLPTDNRALREIAANVPYDTLIVMVNHDRYGGGGIAGRYCTFTAHGPFAGYLLLHELGHSFGGLADEYYTSSTATTDLHSPELEPAEPNITAHPDRDQIKWAALVDPTTPLPTPWDKVRFDAEDFAYQVERRALDEAIAQAARRGALAVELEILEAAAERHALRRAAAVDAFMNASGLLGTVGAFEGAGYVAEGLYRPTIDCLMFSRGVKALCPVCRGAVAARIKRATGR